MPTFMLLPDRYAINWNAAFK